MDQVADIREKVDIVALLSEFISLKRAGRNFKANCPFHNEKSPSFVVSPERQIWHCFGCQKGGDCYSFLMEYEHLEFPEALRLLAKRTGVELIQSQFSQESSSKKETIYKLNKLACDFYHYVLTKHTAGKRGLEYLEKRLVKPAVIETFMIGFAPGVGNALSKFLIEKKKFKREDIVEAGLATQRGNDITDFFVNRLIFPLFDHRDNIVGFSGRVIEDSSTVRSKYINTRETLAYHKGDTFFGIQISKNTIKKENQAMLVEGEFDVLSCFQEGIANTLAIKGTALTDNQAKLLSRFAQKATICFDGDKAGQEAIKRSLPILEKRGLNTTVVVIPNGKDPDESIKKDPYEFKKAIKNDVGVYDYLLAQSFASFDKKTAEGKKKITDELLPSFSAIENEIIKEHYLKKLSVELDTSYESISKEVERRIEAKGVPLVTSSAKEKRSREDILEEYLVSLIVQSEKPKEAADNAAQVLLDMLPKERAYQKILHHLFLHFQQNKIIFNSKAFGDSLPKELLDAYNTAFVVLLPKLPNSDAYLQEAAHAAGELKALYLREKIRVIGEKIKEKEKPEDSEEFEKLQQEFTKLVSLLQKS